MVKIVVAISIINIIMYHNHYHLHPQTQSILHPESSILLHLIIIIIIINIIVVLLDLLDLLLLVIIINI